MMTPCTKQGGKTIHHTTSPRPHGPNSNPERKSDTRAKTDNDNTLPSVRACSSADSRHRDAGASTSSSSGTAPVRGMAAWDAVPEKTGSAARASISAVVCSMGSRTRSQSDMGGSCAWGDTADLTPGAIRARVGRPGYPRKMGSLSYPQGSLSRDPRPGRLRKTQARCNVDHPDAAQDGS